MVRIQASVDIRADPAAVFDLVTDVSRKARLNPNAEVLLAEKMTRGPVGVGTVFLYRLNIGGRLLEYQSRCVAFEPSRLMETLSSTHPPFSVRVVVEPIPGGARLTQEEWFRSTAMQRRRFAPRGLRAKLRQALSVLRSADPLARYAALKRDREARLEAELRPLLVRWLQAIKEHLEADPAARSGP